MNNGNADELLEKYNNLIHLVVKKRYTLLKYKYEYDDLFQIACIGFLKAIDKYDDKKSSNFINFAYNIMDFEILHYARDDKYYGSNRENRINNSNLLSLDYEYDDGVTLSTLLFDNDFNLNRCEVMDLVDKLPERLKTCVYMYFFNGYTQNEISLQLNISQNTVSKLISNALNILRKELISK